MSQAGGRRHRGGPGGAEPVAAASGPPLLHDAAPYADLDSPVLSISGRPVTGPNPAKPPIALSAWRFGADRHQADPDVQGHGLAQLVANSPTSSGSRSRPPREASPRATVSATDRDGRVASFEGVARATLRRGIGRAAPGRVARGVRDDRGDRRLPRRLRAS